MKIQLKIVLFEAMLPNFQRLLFSDVFLALFKRERHHVKHCFSVSFSVFHCFSVFQSVSNCCRLKTLCDAAARVKNEIHSLSVIEAG